MRKQQLRTDVLSLAVSVNPDRVDRAMTMIEIEGQIKMISDALKGPLSNTDRGCMVADRRELRARLAELSQEKP